MHRYILSPPAAADLEEILVYVAIQFSPAAADKLDAEFHEAMERIAISPRIGHVRTDFDTPGLRCVLVHKFIILYAPESNPVEVVRIVHGARDLAGLFANWPRPE